MPKCVAVYSGILESKTNKLQFNNPINIMVTVILGVFALAYGLFTLYLRIFKQSKGLGKLDRMKDVYGEKIGKAIHIISYTVLPLLIGVMALVCHFVLGFDIF